MGLLLSEGAAMGTPGSSRPRRVLGGAHGSTCCLASPQEAEAGAVGQVVLLAGGRRSWAIAVVGEETPSPSAGRVPGWGARRCGLTERGFARKCYSACRLCKEPWRMVLFDRRGRARVCVVEDFFAFEGRGRKLRALGEHQ